MRVLLAAVCLLSTFSLDAAVTCAQTPAPTVQKQKLVASDVDVDFALRTVESGVRQYNALSDDKKRKLEVQIAKAAGVKDVNVVSQTLRMLAAQVDGKTLATRENRAMVKAFLDTNPKWCGTVKATRVMRRAMEKMGMKGELSLDDIVNLLPAE